MTSTVPPTWCPGLPGAERIARFLLDQRMPANRYDLSDPAAVRRALSTSVPGNLLQETLDRREQILAEERRRVGVVVSYLFDATGDMVAALADEEVRHAG